MAGTMGDVIFFNNQEEFNDWLEEHHAEASEIWVGFFGISTGRASLTWSSSVDAALCFGWIDGIRKTMDKQSYKIRFTPRKVNSVWSAVNVKKVQALIQLGKMRPEGMHVFNNRTDAQGYSSEQRNVELAKEYEEQIKANQTAWLFFTNLSPSYKRDSIWWVMSAKKEETRLRRLGILVALSEEGLKIPILQKNNRNITK
ncbi:YdeI/OmpD-associated family protein [Bacillus mobilis]|uniref:YdeI/OmpD-associated family protein n=2 Tax=Bacillus cereus group TaxID=86661 RepID=UPI002E22E6DC|nr:YdeI/OmpD-associated family protein [Bacillus mobilis]MED1003155.1 YdeI/OmpD-associated family protein [Bacillus mobilis]